MLHVLLTGFNLFLTMSGLVSWNICGLRKLARHPGVLSWLCAQKIILLQETLQVTRSFRFPGFARFEVPAVDIRGKASGGLIILIAKDWLGSGKVEVLLESSSLLLLRVSWSNVGMLMGNVYVPIHSENCPSDIYTTTTAQIESVTSLYPNDAAIIGTNTYSVVKSSILFNPFIQLILCLRKMYYLMVSGKTVHPSTSKCLFVKC
jgi:hypothetical protein